MVVLGGWAFSYERGTPASHTESVWSGDPACFPGWLVPKAHRRMYHSALGMKVSLSSRREGDLAQRRSEHFQAGERAAARPTAGAAPVFKAHTRMYHSALGVRETKKKNEGVHPSR